MHQFADSSLFQPFSPGNLEALLRDLEKSRPRGRAVAAFDADGTLWNTDMGEAFFDYQIKNDRIRSELQEPLPEDPWGHYTWLKEKVSHTKAYLWLAQILKGVELSKVRRWAEECASAEPLPVFKEQLRIIGKLNELHVEIYIVTASITWAVEPGARRLGIRENQVLGIETEVVGGRITDKPRGVITYREGKAEALLAATGGVKPYFCAGNTEGDKWLLEAATAKRLVISSAPEGTENYGTEMKMQAMAKEHGWYRHRYLE